MKDARAFGFPEDVIANLKAQLAGGDAAEQAGRSGRERRPKDSVGRPCLRYRIRQMMIARKVLMAAAGLLVVFAQAV